MVPSTLGHCSIIRSLLRTAFATPQIVQRKHCVSAQIPDNASTPHPRHALQESEGFSQEQKDNRFQKTSRGDGPDKTPEALGSSQDATELTLSCHLGCFDEGKNKDAFDALRVPRLKFGQPKLRNTDWQSNREVYDNLKSELNKKPEDNRA